MNHKLLTRAEAAERCRCSLAAFDAHVRPVLTPKRIGRRVLFLESDLDAWAAGSLSSDAETKPGPSRVQPRPVTGAPGSPLVVALRSGPLGRETQTRLTRKLRGSLQRLEQETSPQPDDPGAKVLPLRSRSSSKHG